MGATRTLAAVAGGATLAAVAGSRIERRTLRQMATVSSPPGWSTPQWVPDATVMVPTDDDAELLVARSNLDAPGRPIVLVHGITSDHHGWWPIAAPLLAAGHPVIGLNQRGHGRSAVGSDGFSTDRLGRDLGIVLGALDLDDVIVVGHSMGGAAALSLMTAMFGGADRVGALVLVSTLASSRRADRNMLLRLQLTGLFDRTKRDDHHAPALTRIVFGHTPPRVFVDDLLAITRRCPTATATGAAQGMLHYDVRAELSRILVPTTVMCGTRDVVTTHRENGAIAAAIPDARFRSVPGAGHMLLWEEPEAVLEEIGKSLGATAPGPPLTTP